MSESFANIRELLGAFIGKRLLDITQHDEQEYLENGQQYVMLMFDDGHYMQFNIGEDGFGYSKESDGDPGDETRSSD